MAYYISMFVPVFSFTIPVLFFSLTKIRLRDYLVLVICVAVSGAAFSYIVNQYIEYFGPNLAVLLGLFLFAYLQTKNMSISLNVPFLCFLIQNLSEHLVLSIFSLLYAYLTGFYSSEQEKPLFEIMNALFAENPELDLIMATIILAVTIGFSILLGRIMRQNLKLLFANRMNITSILIALLLGLSMSLSYSISGVSLVYGVGNPIIMMLYYIYPVYLLLVILIIFYLSKFIEKDLKIAAQQELLLNIREYTELIENMYNSVRSFRHDYINMLSTLTIFLKEKRYEELEQYVEEKILPTGTKMDCDNFSLALLSNIRILELKGVLSYKAIVAQERHINFHVEVVEEVHDFNIDIIDLCKIVGILLDNAIEESMLCAAPYIIFCVVIRNESKSIVIKNKCRQVIASIDEMFSFGFSTKGSNRGIGLATVKSILNQYENCLLETEINQEEITFNFDIYN